MQYSGFAPARLIGLATLVATTLAACPMAAGAAQSDSQHSNDHQAALAALTDLRAAVGEIVQADASNSTDRAFYHRASQRAINALEGTHGADYTAAAGAPGDAAGAIGHIDALLDRKETPVWAEPLRSAETNMRVAVTHLQDASHARELMDYQISISRALIYLEVAEGRSTQTGVFGGLEGALANTVLGVPAGASQADACAQPASAPAYGTHGGYIGWVSVPAAPGEHTLAENPGGDELSLQNNFIVLRTAAAPIVAKACGKNTASGAKQAAATQKQPVASASASAEPAGTKAGGLPALYTEAQAKQGEQIFGSKCVSCHGGNLQGVAAPSVAGTDFLKTSQQNGWTVAIIRYIVFDMMPMNAAKSLSAEQYSQVMAFLLASNCYPAGSTPFPQENKPDLAKIKLVPVPGHPAGQNGKGVCPVG